MPFAVQQAPSGARNSFGAKGKMFRRKLLIFPGWALAVLLFAGQWYAYDAGHGQTDPFIYYVGWSCYLWGVLTPSANTFGIRM